MANRLVKPQRATGLLILAASVIVLQAAIILAVIDFASISTDEGFWTDHQIIFTRLEPATIAILAGGIGLILGFVIARFSKDAEDRVDNRMGADVLGLVPLMLTIAVAATVVVYILPVDEPSRLVAPGVADSGVEEQATEPTFGQERKDAWDRWNSFIALGTGILLGGATGFAAALVQYSRTGGSSADEDYVREIARRVVVLNANVNAWCPPAEGVLDANATLGLTACGEAAAIRATLQRDLGIEIGATAASAAMVVTAATVSTALDRDVVGLWTRLHDAEEALLYVAPEPHVMGEGLFDELRLKDANIGQAEELRLRLRRAVVVIGGWGYLTTPPEIPAKQTPQAGDAFAARTVLRGVRHAINEFRDSRRGGLLRARNNLSWTGLLTGVTAYALLGIAILVEVPTRFVVAAVVYYLVAAMIGLFNQLRISSRPNVQQTEEDYGLARAQLLYQPVLAGLAGVGGVVVTALLFAVLNGNVIEYRLPDIAVSATPIAADASPSAANTEENPAGDGQGGDTALSPARDARGDPPRLTEIFDLDLNRFGLVIAGVFGLTPGLLVDRLQGLAARYKADLRSTTAQDGAG